MEARRAVSTVPPMTTSFCKHTLDVEAQLEGGAPPAGGGEGSDWLTRVSVIAVELTPKGDSRLETACMIKDEEEGKEQDLKHSLEDGLLLYRF